MQVCIQASKQTPLRASVAGGPWPGAKDVAWALLLPTSGLSVPPAPPVPCWISAHRRLMRLCNSFGMHEDVFSVISTAFLFCVTWSFRTTHHFRSPFSWTKIYIKIQAGLSTALVSGGCSFFSHWCKQLQSPLLTYLIIILLISIFSTLIICLEALKEKLGLSL